MDDDFGFFDSYNGDAYHDMWVDFNYYQNTGELSEYFDSGASDCFDEPYECAQDDGDCNKDYIYDQFEVNPNNPNGNVAYFNALTNEEQPVGSHRIIWLGRETWVDDETYHKLKKSVKNSSKWEVNLDYNPEKDSLCRKKKATESPATHKIKWLGQEIWVSEDTYYTIKDSIKDFDKG